jgi:hypothetical protein
VWRGPGSCSLAACLRVRRCAWAVQARAARTLSRRPSCPWSSASCRSSSSRSLSSSLCTRDNGDGAWHAQRVSDVGAARAAEVASAFAARVRARCACCGPADSQPMASDAKHAILAFDVSACFQVRAKMAGEARTRTRGACVSSVLCTRVLVCKAQSSERRRGSGEAKPGARHASLCAFFCSLCSRANTRSVHIPHAASKPHRQPTSLRSWLVLLGPEAAYIGGDGGAVGDAALSRVDAHGAQAIHGASKRKEEDQKDGSTASSTRAARRR